MVLLIIDEKTKDWKQISEEEKKKLPEEQQEKVLYLDGKYKKKLDFSLSQRDKDNDAIGIFVGKEGSGKSSLAGNTMRYISKDNFNPMEHLIGSDYEDGIEKINKTPNKGFLMFDEGNVFFLSTDVMKKEARDFHKIFSIFRQKNLFVVICLPSFFRLSSYFALDRSDFLCKTYLKKGKRGCFAYYGTKRKTQLYYKGREIHNMNAVPPTFRGKFTKCISLENPEYKKFKLKTLEQSIQVAKEPKRMTPTQAKAAYVKEVVHKNIDVKAKELAKILGYSISMIKKIKQDIREKQNYTPCSG